ncbi:MAG TPA: hypothetical protein VIA80_13480 [Hyphomonadaceae bacterium]
MDNRCFALAACLLLSPAAFAQAPAAYEPPRTREGRPDFHGVWLAAFLTRFERPDSAQALAATPEQERVLVASLLSRFDRVEDPDITHTPVRELAAVRGEARTSLLVEPADGRMPLSAKGLAAVARRDALDKNGFDHPEDRPLAERCLGGSAHAPMRTWPIVMTTQIVQTPQAVVITNEDVAGFRTIHLGSAAPPDHPPSFEGWSTGRWEGDTLVVETTGFRPDDPARGQYGRPILVGPDSRVVERFSRLSDDELLYEFTVEDADLYASPWRAEYSFTRVDDQVYEYACHEANYSMTNMLLGGRIADAKAAGK